MDQNQNSQKKNNESFFQKNQNYIIAGVIVVLLVIYFATQNPENEQPTIESQSTEELQSNSETETPTTDTETKTTEEKKSEEAKAPETKTGETTLKSESKTSTETPKTESSKKTSGNLNVSGKLSKSDNESKGNLMVVKGTTKYYISTKRDFSQLVGKDVTLDAQGDASKFTFNGFKEAGASGQTSSAQTDTTAMGGSAESTPAKKPESYEYIFSGKLEKSEDTAKGNYVVRSGKQQVYLKTGKDYSSLVGSEVKLQAKGDMKNFSGAVLAKK